MRWKSSGILGYKFERRCGRKEAKLIMKNYQRLARAVIAQAIKDANL